MPIQPGTCPKKLYFEKDRLCYQNQKNNRNKNFFFDRITDIRPPLKKKFFKNFFVRCWKIELNFDYFQKCN